ncbi:MAG: ribonuclease J [Candidatus Melainabacteria bacterium]|nr:ribonuclease J [Candidatus Melainabacteria bacterium]
MTNSKETLKAIPLGGHGEIGKNSWVFEYKDEIIIVNFGMMLPGNSLSGVDLILPSTNYLIENQKKIKGLIITSGHDDSCGGVFYLLEKVKIPKIWGSELGIEVIKNQLLKNVTLPETEIIKPRKELQIGDSFTIKPIRNTFCLPDTYGLLIQTPQGNILYTGSYKIDQTPSDKELLDYFSYAQAGEDGVDLLISDSTNIESSGYSQSEINIIKRFDEIIKNSNSRIIIVGYANSLFKYEIIFKLALKHNKKVLLSGEHLINKIQAAIKTSFIKVDKNLFIQYKDIANVKDKELIIIMSGKYGDFLSSLIEIAKEKHEHIKLKPKDIVVISATAPPGTARILAHTIDQLYVQKVQVISSKVQDVHVSSHAAQEEAKFMLTIAKPRSFVPSHGEERQLVTYGNIAESMEVSPNDIHILKNGDILELREQVARARGKIQAQSIYYNQAKGLDIDESTMKERQTLSEEGTITIALTLNEERSIIAGPEIIAKGCSFAKGKDWRAFTLGTIELIKDTIKQALERNEKELPNLKSQIRDVINKTVLELINKRPLINVSIQEVKKVISHKL